MRIAVDRTQTLEELRQFYRLDREGRLVANLIRRLADPAKPQDEQGRFRPHPLLLWLVVITMVASAVFVYFTYNLP